MKVDIDILDSDGKLIDSLTYSSPMSIPENQPITQQFMLLNVHTFHLPIGEYKISILAEDELSDKQDNAELDVRLHNYWSEKPTFSDIMLSYSASPTDENTPLNKLGYRMFPNPSGVYSINSLIVYHYSEFYFPDTSVRRVGIGQSVYHNDTLFRRFQTEWFTVKGASWYISGFSVAGFPDGDYNLKLELLDTMEQVIATVSRDFTVVKTLSEETLAISEKNVSDMRNILLYLLTPKELATFDNLKKEGKVNFWERFWDDRDPTPDTDRNELLEQYLARWDYVNRTFSSGNIPGWKNDRGRIYLVYGPPDDVEHHSFNISSNAWEQWSYYNENMFFIFADPLGLGNMKLMHSNVEGEINDPYWRDKISSPGGTQFYKQIEE
ncbi:hypothetical protein DRQ33_06350 [bacterium]|nr:MAG: hypothetical protein DRQ33_06350 [bacterium]